MGPFYGQCGLVDNVAADVKKTLRTHTTGCLDMCGVYQLQVKTVSSCKFYSILILVLITVKSKDIEGGYYI